MRNRVGVIGGGAAGMAAAISAAAGGAQVTLLEGNDRLGKKLLSTGNGKCNLGNEKLDLEEYYTGSPELLEKCLNRFGTKETLSFFQGIGLMTGSRRGYLYPLCQQASAVLDVLRHEVAARGIDVVTECKAESIRCDRETGRLRVSGSGREFQFDKVILACGGCAAPRTGSDGSGFTLARQLGHSLVPVVPALVQLRCREDYFKSVAGVRADAVLTVLHQGRQAAQERGELLLTDYGLSGIPVFQLSRVVNYILLEDGFRKDSGDGGNRAAGRGVRADERDAVCRGRRVDGRDAAGRGRHADERDAAGRSRADGEREDINKDGNKDVEIRINLLPDYTEDVFLQLIEDRKRDLMRGHRTVEEFFAGMLHKKLMLLFIRLAGLKPAESAAGADQGKLLQVYRLCRRWSVHVTGSNSYDNAQVCAGGVPLEEVTDDLESKKAPGVYFAGEILDVDGKCGGYNLQWAWCSGHLAGRAAAGNGAV